MKAFRVNRIIILVVICAALLFSASSTLGQSNVDRRVEIPSSPNPVGSGARTLGMAGAFIAVADDATAASSNPGGLIQLEYPEASVVVDYVHGSGGNTLERSGWESDPVDEVSLNYLSVAYPFERLGRNMIVSLNYQHLYNFNGNWKFESNPIEGRLRTEFEQDGALYALGLAYCVQITPDFSAGMTINYWGDFLYKNGWEKNNTTRSELTIVTKTGALEIDKKNTFSFEGWNANLGFLWRISERWTLGGVFKSPFTADIDCTTKYRRTWISSAGVDEYMDEVDYREELDMPMSYGVGIAYRHSDNLTISADIHRTHWEDFIYRLQDGRETSPVTTRSLDESDIDPTIWLRLGAEYLHIRDTLCIPFRAGVFYDPAPGDGSPDDYFGFSLGTGLAYKRWIFDIAYQYRFGNDVGASTLSKYNFSRDVREHTVYTSLIVHF